MFVRYRGKMFLPLFVFLAAGCASNQGKLATDIARLQRELSDLRSFQAEQTSQIATLQTEMRGLTGRVEELEFGQSRKLGGDISQLNQDLQSLKRRVPPPPIVPLMALEQDESFASSLQGEVGRLFSEALQRLREGAYADSLALLNESLAQSYNAAWAPNLSFWLGVAHDGLGDNRSALRAYHDLVSGYPKHERVPLALLRQGSVFIRLRDSASAKLVFQKLINQYPKSAEAQVAKQRLKDV